MIKRLYLIIAIFSIVLANATVTNITDNNDVKTINNLLKQANQMQKEYDSKYCLDAMTQDDMNGCSQLKYSIANNMLKSIILEVEKQLSDQEKIYLEISQKAWNNLLEYDCKITSKIMEGGREQYMNVTGCKTSHIKQRIDNLIVYVCGEPSVECEAQNKYENYLHPPQDTSLIENAKLSTFKLNKNTATDKVLNLSYYQSLKAKYPNIIMFIENQDNIDDKHIYIYLGFDEKTHTTRHAFVRVDSNGTVEYSKLAPTSKKDWKKMP